MDSQSDPGDADTSFPDLDQDALHATLDLIGRTGARELSIGHLHDDVPADEAAWWATATYQGAKLSVENHAGPLEALEALARKLLSSSRCVRCGRFITLSDPAPDRAAEQCRWRRTADRWEPGCPTSHPPEPGDEIHTTEKLARALEALDDPSLTQMIIKARAGYYHAFLSPLDMPEMQLFTELRAAGHDQFARRVADGEFDATKAESEAWSNTAEGRAVHAELMPGGKPVPGSPLASMIDVLSSLNDSHSQADGNRAARRGNRQKPKRGKRGRR